MVSLFWHKGQFVIHNFSKIGLNIIDFTVFLFFIFNGFVFCDSNQKP